MQVAASVASIAFAFLLTGAAPALKALRADADAGSGTQDQTSASWWVISPRSAEGIREATRAAEPPLTFKGARVSKDRAAEPDDHPLLLPLTAAPDEPPTAGSNSIAYALAFGYIVCPFLLGWVLGRFHGVFVLKPRRRFTARWSGALLLAGPSALLLSSLAIYPLIGLWDALALGSTAGLGLWAGGHAQARTVRRDRLIVLSISTLIAALLLEAGSRLLLPAPPLFPPPRDLPFTATHLTPQGRRYLAALYPTHYPHAFRRQVSWAHNAKIRVLHVGDSMTYGAGVDHRYRFTTLMNNRTTGVAHVNAGVRSTATDYQFLLISRWLPLFTVDHVVHHVMPGTDLSEIDQSTLSCPEGSILLYEPHRLRARCPQPPARLRYTVSAMLRSPLPYPIRVATDFSVAARHLCAVPVRAVRRRQRYSRSLHHLTRILREASRIAEHHKVLYSVVLVPNRPDLRISRPGANALGHLDIIAFCRRHGIRVFDGHTHFQALVLAAGGDQHLFVDGLHFSREGHRAYASWLDEILKETPGFGRVIMPAKRH